MASILKTERLILRKFQLSDAESMYLLNLDPEVIRYTGDAAFKDIDEAKSFLENYSDYIKNGYGRWAVILKETTEFIGWCGLKLNSEGFVDVGFRFFQIHWNKGYATEAARACLSYGFDSLNIQTIIGRASLHPCVGKIGMTYWKIDRNDELGDAVYWKINRTNISKNNT